MINSDLLVCALGSEAATTLYAQDIAGDWEGVLKMGSEETRHILRIAKGEGGGWNAKVFAIDQTKDWELGISVAFAIRGSNLKFTIDRMQFTYEGKVSTDGASIAGTWTQGRPRSLAFKRATRDTASHDPSRHRIQFIAANTTT